MTSTTHRPRPALKPKTLVELALGLSFARREERPLVLADAAAVTAADRVLDIGCGPGTAVAEAVRRGASAVGLDPSSSMLWLTGRRTPSDRVTLLQGTVESIGLADCEVTVAWAAGSFHHWPDVARALAEVGRVLAPGGRLVILEREAHGHGFHAAHAISRDRAERLVGELAAAGFVDASVEAPTVDGAAHLIVRARLAT